MHADKPKELQICKPRTFSGDRREIRDFIADLRLYLSVNEKIYDDSEKKISFALSFIRGGEAGRWKEDFLREAQEAWDRTHPLTTGEGFKFDSWTKFLKKLKEQFDEEEIVDDAFDVLRTFQQGNKNIFDHITRFKLLISRAGITQEQVIIDFFKRSLDRRLAEKIVTLGQPKTLENWYTKAKEYDGAGRKWARSQLTIKRRDPYDNPTPSKSTRDEYAMDTTLDAIEINAMDKAKQDELRKKGACYKCEGKGHLARDCPTKVTVNYKNRGNFQGKSPQGNKNSTDPKKSWKGKEFYAHIRATADDMDDEEKELLVKSLEEEGF